jgi:hypothetical protein
MMSRLTKFLCWTPILGPIIDDFVVEPPYLSSHPKRFKKAIIWNIAWSVLFIVIEWTLL